MPKEWHDRHAASKIGDERTRVLYKSIVADKKPYFMRYIYPSLMKQYNTYIKNTDKNALREFQLTISEMTSKPYDELTDRQKEFLRYYEQKMPVGTGNCVMNKICRRFESEFDGYIGKFNKERSFDYSIMSSGSSYTSTQYYSVKRLYDWYNKRLQNYMIFADYERVDKAESSNQALIMRDEFIKECEKQCPNSEALCDIILDICYTRNSTRRFAWSVCGDTIIHNLLSHNNNTISYPTMSKDGDIVYGGKRYILESKRIEVE